MQEMNTLKVCGCGRGLLVGVARYCLALRGCGFMLKNSVLQLLQNVISLLRHKDDEIG